MITTFKRDSKNKQSAEDLAFLWREVERRGWDPIGAFALIREESAWNPAIKNSIGATGFDPGDQFHGSLFFTGFPTLPLLQKWGFGNKWKRLYFHIGSA